MFIFMSDQSKDEKDPEHKKGQEMPTDGRSVNHLLDVFRTFIKHQAGNEERCRCDYCSRLTERIAALLEEVMRNFPRFEQLALYCDEVSLFAEVSAEGSRLRARWPCRVCDGRLASCATSAPHPALELSSDQLALALAFVRLARFRPTHLTSLRDRELSAFVMAGDVLLLMRVAESIRVLG